MSEKINHGENVRKKPEENMKENSSENMSKGALEKPLEEIRSITGIPFQLADHSISDEEMEKRLTFLLKSLKTSTPGLSQTEILRQLLTGELSSDGRRPSWSTVISGPRAASASFSFTSIRPTGTSRIPLPSFGKSQRSHPPSIWK